MSHVLSDYYRVSLSILADRGADLWVVGDVKAGHASLFQRILLVQDLLVDLSDDLLVHHPLLLPHTLFQSLKAHTHTHTYTHPPITWLRLYLSIKLHFSVLK